LAPCQFALVVIATDLERGPVALQQLKAARLGGLFLVDADLSVHQITDKSLLK
jgi:hypothetical protein